MIFRGIRKIHMVGIGGSGMAGIAEVLGNLGFTVTGSDLKDSPAINRLRSQGIKVAIGHHPDHVRGSDVLVYSSAIGPDNPEVRAARKLNIPVIRRAEMLAELMRMKVGVAVAGSHGKTTVTGLIAHICQQADLDPTAVIGGRLDSLGGGARLGAGDLLIAEADESDGSFLHLSPVIGVVTNIDREHLDFYRTEKALQSAFADFLNHLPFYGRGVVCSDDPSVRNILPGVERPLLTYGLEKPADLSAADIARQGMATSFTLVVRGQPLLPVFVPLVGDHNILNTLAAVGVALDLGIEPEVIQDALPAFKNASRRFETLCSKNGLLVIDDYGHHPTEIKAVLKTARNLKAAGKIVVVFQPHRYSRSSLLLEDFRDAFAGADTVIVTEIYSAGEDPLPGVNGAAIADRISKGGRCDVVFQPTLKEAAENLIDTVGPEDIVLTLGAGDVREAAEIFIKKHKDLSK